LVTDGHFKGGAATLHPEFSFFFFEWKVENLLTVIQNIYIQKCRRITNPKDDDQVQEYKHAW